MLHEVPIKAYIHTYIKILPIQLCVNFWGICQNVNSISARSKDLQLAQMYLE